MISAIGASFFLQYTVSGLVGPGIFRYPRIDILNEKVPLPVFEALGIKWIDVVVIVSALVMMAALYAFVMRSKMGTAIRAVSEDKDTAALMGIDVNRAIVTTFAVGAAMAGAAGVLFGLVWGQVQFFTGFIPGIKAFTAAVLGGIGNIPGAMVGGFVLGEAEFDRLAVVPRRPRCTGTVPAQGRHRLHHPRARADVPAPGHPRRAALEVPRVSTSATAGSATTLRRLTAWKQVFIVGLLFAGTMLYVTLVGIVGTFQDRDIIQDVVTLGEAILVVTAIAAGYFGAMRAPDGPVNRIIGSVVAGFMAGAALSILLVIGPAMGLREYLPNASPQLYDLISGSDHRRRRPRLDQRHGGTALLAAGRDGHRAGRAWRPADVAAATHPRRSSSWAPSDSSRWVSSRASCAGRCCRTATSPVWRVSCSPPTACASRASSRCSASFCWRTWCTCCCSRPERIKAMPPEKKRHPAVVLPLGGFILLIVVLLPLGFTGFIPSVIALIALYALMALGPQYHAGPGRSAGPWLRGLLRRRRLYRGPADLGG